MSVPVDGGPVRRPVVRVSTDPVASGGPTDPRSRYLVDIDAVHHACRRYEGCADGIRVQAVTLRALARELLGSVRLDDPVAALALARDAAHLVTDAAALERHADDRTRLAGRARTAVVLYRQVDEDGAARFDRLLRGPIRDTTLPANPWALERSGRCSTTPREPGGPPGYAPTCPGIEGERSRIEDLYPAQDLELGPVTTVPSTGAPGVAGIMQAVHDAYGARTLDGRHETDVIDVQKRLYRAADGTTRESYLVALPGTSRWDLPHSPVDPHRHRTMRPNLEGASGIASAEARLVPQALVAAGVPDGAEVLLAGHSQGGMTAVAAAALPAMRRYNVQVLTAGSPVARSADVPSVRYLHVATRGDVVPTLDRAPNRPLRNQVTVSTGVERDPVTAHRVDTYVADLEHLDRARADGTLPDSVVSQLEAMDQAGHLRAVGEDDAYVTTRVHVRRRS